MNRVSMGSSFVLTFLISLVLSVVVIVPQAWAEEESEPVTDGVVVLEDDSETVVDPIETPRLNDENVVNDIIYQEAGAERDGSTQLSEEIAIEGDNTDVSANQMDLKSDDNCEASLSELAGHAVQIALADNPSYALDVYGASLNEGAATQLYEANDTPAQRFRIERIAGTEYSVIYNTFSGLVITVVENGANDYVIQQYSFENSPKQMWSIVESDAGGFSFLSALEAADSEKYALTALRAENYGALTLQIMQGSMFQSWIVSEPEHEISDGIYAIQSSVADNRVLDVEGFSKDSGANVFSYAYHGGSNQQFLVFFNERVGYYEIVSACSGKALDVAGAANGNGVNVWQYDRNGTYAQYWRIEQLENATYRIISAASGCALDVAGASRENCANVQMYEWNATNAQIWIFLFKGDLPSAQSERVLADGSYVIRSGVDPSKALDISGASIEKGANAQSYTANATTAQSFYVQWDKATGYYTIVNEGSGKALDVSAASKDNGANVCQYDRNGTAAQQWIIERYGNDAAHPFRVISVCSGLALDVSAASNEDGANVWQYERNGTVAQQWGFESPLSIQACLPVGDSSCNVQTSLVQGIRYLFLPSYVACDSVELLVSMPDMLETFYYANDSTNSFVETSGLVLFALAFDSQQASGYRDLLISAQREGAATLLRVMHSANIRTMFIASSNPLEEGREYIESSVDHSLETTGGMALVKADGTLTYDGGLTQIRGRGNSSWIESSKKPYQIKLAKKTGLIDGTNNNAAKTWVLLSNGQDESLMRNYIAQITALESGIPYSMECAYIDLYYDGEYRGMYLLSEKVQINKGRVDIKEIENNSSDDVDLSLHATEQALNKYSMAFQYVVGVEEDEEISGGYLLELDCAYYRDERSWFETSAGVFVIKSPEDASESQVRYISEFVQEALNSISGSSSDAASFFDLATLAKVYLLNEISKNPDFCWTSTYFYKDANEDLLIAGPAWDFDFAFGTATPYASAMSTTGYISRGWVNYFFKENDSFKQVLAESAESVISLFRTWIAAGEGIFGDEARTIDDLQATLQASADMNAVAVGSFCGSGQRVVIGSFSGAVEYLEDWLTSRLSWIEEVFEV